MIPFNYLATRKGLDRLSQMQLQMGRLPHEIGIINCSAAPRVVSLIGKKSKQRANESILGDACLE